MRPTFDDDPCGTLEQALLGDWSTDELQRSFGYWPTPHQKNLGQQPGSTPQQLEREQLRRTKAQARSAIAVAARAANRRRR